MPIPHRIRRNRAESVVESTPVRVRRVRTVVTEPVKVVKRTRVRGAASAYEDSRPVFVMDWGKSLGYKLQIYLVTSYLYYHLSRSVITDHEFDRLCKELAEGWDTFTHQHKKYTDRASMEAATGYANKYPLMVRSAAISMLDNFREVRSW